MMKLNPPCEVSFLCAQKCDRTPPGDTHMTLPKSAEVFVQSYPKQQTCVSSVQRSLCVQISVYATSPVRFCGVHCLLHLSNVHAVQPLGANERCQSPSSTQHRPCVFHVAKVSSHHLFGIRGSCAQSTTCAQYAQRCAHVANVHVLYALCMRFGHVWGTVHM